MLEIDFPSAVRLVKPFDDNARKVLATLEAMTHRVVRDADERAAASAALADRTRVAVAATATIVSLMLLGLAVLLTRATIRSVRQIAQATSLVAKGDQSVDIAALQRSDELGTIVQSLAAFQANVAQVAFLAHHDSLTSLPNRILFRDRVTYALKLLGRGNIFALFFLDLDHFKQVNDTLGHPVGDALLGQVGDRLQACVREGDTVARLGGDEFAVLLLSIDAAERLAQRIIEVISMPYDVAGFQVNISTSIGIALAPATDPIRTSCSRTPTWRYTAQSLIHVAPAASLPSRWMPNCNRAAPSNSTCAVRSSRANSNCSTNLRCWPALAP